MILHSKFGAGVVVGLSLMVGSTALADIPFVANYTDSAGEGFFDPSLGLQRRTAFEYSLNIWGGILQSSYTGQTITINAAFDPMGSGVLGGAGANHIFTDVPNGVPNTWYGSALANHVAGSDLNAAAEISATFNSSFSDWYLGTDGNTPSNKWDFATVVLHEVGHGLNFFDLIDQDGTWFASNIPGIYDRFLEIGNGTDLTAMTDAQRAAAIISGDLFWNGADGMAGNGGTRPELYAPATYQGGSSVSHLDDGAHPNSLMNPGIFNGSAIHFPSEIEIGMLTDMGWSIPEPASVAVFGVFGLMLLRRRRAA